MTKTVLVNYVGGYCGNFLTGLIGEALGVNHTLRQRSDKNTYYYLSNDIHTKYTKIFGKLFDIRKGVLKKEDLKYIAFKKKGFQILEPFLFKTNRKATIFLLLYILKYCFQ